MDIKELEKKNAIYVTLKEKLTTIKEETTRLKSEIDDTNLILTREELESKKKTLEEYRKQLVAIQEEMNKLIEEVMKDPEVKKQLEEALQLAKEKAVQEVLNEIAKKKEEKEELTKEKNKLDRIIIVVKTNPQVKEALMKVLKCKVELKKLRNEIDECTQRFRKVAIKSELNKKGAELTKALSNLREETDRVNIKIEKKEIDNIVGFIKNEDEMVNLDDVLNKYSKHLNQQIDGKTSEIEELEKKNKPYKLEKNKQGETVTYYTSKGGVSGEKKGEDRTIEVGEEGKSFALDTGKSEEVEEDKNDKKPQWWNIIKAINIWNTRRKEARNKKKKEGETEEHKEGSSSKRENLMKYLIVQDAYKIMEEKARKEGTLPTITRDERE